MARRNNTTKQQQRKKKALLQKKKKKKTSSDKVKTSPPRWIDRLAFEPIVVAAATAAAAVSDTIGNVADSGCDDAADAAHANTSSPLEQSLRSTNTGPLISLITWNVLAETYCTRRSQRCLPAPYRGVVFARKRRRRRVERIQRILHHFTEILQVDVLCLQEVDEIVHDMIDPVLTSQKVGYRKAIETPRSRAYGRIDSVVIYVKDKQIIKEEEKEVNHDNVEDSNGRKKYNTNAINNKNNSAAVAEWEIVEDDGDNQNSSVVQLDDLATLSGYSNYDNNNSSVEMEDGENSSSNIKIKSNSDNNKIDSTGTRNCTIKTNGINGNKKIVTSANNLQGLQQSFLRRNAAVFLRLRHKITKQTIVISSAHLYWHPGYEYVKICQAHYILLRAREFLRHNDEPFVFCGDFNSRPHGAVQSYLTDGTLSAKRFAPWYYKYNKYHNDYSKKDDKVEVDDDSAVAVAADGTVLTKGDRSDRQDGVRRTGGSSTDASENESDENGESSVEDEEDDDDNSSDYDEDDDSDDSQHSNNIRNTNGQRDTNHTLEETIDQVANLSIQESISQKDKKDGTVTDSASGNILPKGVDLAKQVKAVDPDDENDSWPPQVRYLLDSTLNKLCRWLRILGQDCALETEEEERMRTKQGVMVLFDRCYRERRTLVTTSTRLMMRKDCPPGTYCINPSFLPYLEVALVHLFLTHGVVLEPKKFLTRCVVCNGSICLVEDPESRRKIYQAPNELADEMEVFQCDGCKQGYWWCEIPTSSASRVKTAATRLFSLCLRAGVPIHGPLETFDYVDVEAERQKGWDISEKGTALLQQKLDVVEWMKSDSLECPFQLESAYADTGVGESLPFTNVTHDFVDCLDYIFSTPKTLHPLERLYVPKTFKELNGRNIPNGHLLPSDIWPSDHLAIGCRFQFVSDENHVLTSPVQTNTTPSSADFNQTTGEVQVENVGTEAPASAATPLLEFCIPTGSMIPPPPSQQSLSTNIAATAGAGAAAPVLHGQLCACGCVPKIPSLFQMAEMRKQAKLKLENKA